MPLTKRRDMRPSGQSRPTATVRSRPVRGLGVSDARAEAARIATAGQRAEAVVAEAKAPPDALPPALRKAVLPFQMGPVKPVRLRKINQMLYGPYGHGKTTYAASALDVPEMRDVVFIAAEPGDMSLTNRRDLDIIVINKYEQVARIFEYLVLHCMWRDEGNIEKLLELEKVHKQLVIPVEDQGDPVHHRYHPNYPDARPEEGRVWFVEQRYRTGKPMDEPYLYRTAIIDSLSELHKYLVYKFTGVDIGKTKLDEEIEKMDDWQVAQEMFRLLIRSFRDLPMHTIFVAAEAIEPAERNKRRNPHAGQALPKLAGQAAADVAGFIDIVGYLNREILPGGETTRYLYLGAGYEGWISKHRFENLPDLDYLEDPTLTKLIALARKDDELYGTSETRPSPPSRQLEARSDAASTAAANSRRSTNSPVRSAGRRGNSLRRAGH